MPAHHGLADGRPNSGSADNEYMCACMEGYEEKTPYAPSHKVHQCLLITASLPTATTPEPMHALAHTVAPTYAPTPAEPGHHAATAVPRQRRYRIATATATATRSAMPAGVPVLREPRVHEDPELCEHAGRGDRLRQGESG